MQKIGYLFTIAVAAILFSSYGAGTFTADVTGNSGLAGGGSSCGSSYCHGGISGADTNRMNVRLLDANGNVQIAYSPGSTYTVEVKLRTYNSTRAGFQSVAALFNGSGGTGTVDNSLMPTQTQTTVVGASNATFVSHTTLGSTAAVSGGYATWRYKWIAPNTNVGAIIIASACNVANNNFQSSGDTCFNFPLVIQAPNAIAMAKKDIGIQVYPNPATNIISVATNNIEVQQYAIADMYGRQVAKGKYNKSIDVSNLASGLYTLLLATNKGEKVAYFKKQ
jgi:hypothetical protein